MQWLVLRRVATCSQGFEQQVVVLLAEALAKSTTLIGCPWLKSSEVLCRISLPSFRSLGRVAVADADAVVVEQAVLARNLEVITAVKTEHQQQHHPH